MRAAKRQKPPLILDGLNGRARTAATKAAREAGMSLDDWVALTVAERTKVATRPAVASSADPDDLDAAIAKLKTVTRRPARPPGPSKNPRPEAHLEKVLAAAAADSERRARKHAETTAVAFGSVASWIERAEDRLVESSRAAAASQERTAKLLSEALAGMTRRLDDIEHKVEDGGHPSMDAALKAVERIEKQLAQAGHEREQAHGGQIEAALRGFEARIAGISDRVGASAPRPIGRRGMESDAEVRSAVDEIRARQAELDEGGPDRAAAGRTTDDVLSSLRGDIARLAGRFDRFQPADVEPAVALIRGEIERLQDAVSGLATRDEVNAIERTMRGLVHQIAAASAPTDVAEVAAAVSTLRGEIRRLSGTVSSGLPRRLARDVDVLADQVDAVAGSGVDPAVVDPLGEQLADIRRLVGEIADPHHVQALERQILALNDRLGELGRQRDEFGDLGARIDALSHKLDRLAEDPHRAAADSLRETIESAPVIAALVQRLDYLDEAIRRPPPAPAPELKPIEDMLRTLVERIDQVERPGAEDGALNALEQQVADLSRRIERSAGGDPALVTLERAMGHLMSQVDSIRDGAFDAAERAASAAVKDTLAVFPPGDEPPEFGLLKRDLAELRANHSASDLRTRETLESVGAALEKVVARLGSLEQHGVGPRLAETAPHLRPAAADVAPAAPAQSAALVKAAASTADSVAPPAFLGSAARPSASADLDEILLEPGAGRPRPPAVPETALDPKIIPADIKASFIAAARRAAQAASAEAAANGVKRTKRGLGPASSAPPGEPSLAARVVQSLDKRRRPILLGLAAIVLALGALQGVGHIDSGPTTTVNAPLQGDGLSDSAAHEPARGPASDGAEPRTTQALPDIRLAEVPALTPLVSPSREFDGPVPATETAALAGPGRSDPKAGPAPATAAKADAKTSPDPVIAQKGDSGSFAEARLSADPMTTGKIETKPQPAPAPAPAARIEAKAPGATVTPASLDAKTPVSAKSEPKTPVFVVAATNPPSAVQISPRVPSSAADQRLSTEPRGPFDRIANIGAVGEIPASIGVPGLRQAAVAGDPAAVYDLAARSAEGRGVPRDLRLAAKLFEAAANHGLVPAQYRIGNHYEKGLGLGRDLALARTWYQRAAEKGNARAMHNLAVILADGAGGKPDYAAAAEWFRRAADLGVRDSQFNLAVLYGRGLGVAQDLVTSFTWFSIAASRGDEDAGKKRDEVGARLTPVELATARKAADGWKVEPLNRATNEVTLPAGGWSEGPPAAATTNVKGPLVGKGV